MISSELPAWLVNRTTMFDRNQSSTAQDIQAGAQLYQQSQQNQRMQRAQQLQEEARQIALDEKERVAAGAVEVTRVLSEMGKTGGYSDPALQAKFWDAVSRNPKFVASPAFKEIVDTFQYAEQAKERSELLKQRYGYREDEAYLRHLDRLAEIGKRGDVQQELLGAKSDFDLLKAEAVASHKQEQIRLQTDENIRRDAAKPQTLRPERFDLNESDRMGMAAELDRLEIWYRDQAKRARGKKDVLAQIESEYDQQFKEIEAKYQQRRKAPRAPEPAAPLAPKAEPVDPNDPFGILK